MRFYYYSHHNYIRRKKTLTLRRDGCYVEETEEADEGKKKNSDIA